MTPKTRAQWHPAVAAMIPDEHRMHNFERSLSRTCGHKDAEHKNGDDALIFVPENHCAPGADGIA